MFRSGSVRLWSLPVRETRETWRLRQPLSLLDSRLQDLDRLLLTPLSMMRHRRHATE
jgi:hypothetical protein